MRKHIHSVSFIGGGFLAVLFGILLVSAASSSFILPLRAYAETIVDGGIISEDAVWKESQSPYVLKSKLQIASGATLTIEPGVAVTFDTTESNAGLIIDGRLIAVGLSDKKIYFTSPVNGGSGQPVLKFESATGTLENVSMSGIGLESYTSHIALSSSTISDVPGVAAVSLNNGSAFMMNNSVITDSSGAAIVAYNHTVPVLQSDGAPTPLPNFQTTVAISSSTISYGLDGIDLLDNAALTLSRSIVEDFDVGVNAKKGSVEMDKSIIRNNQVGVRVTPGNFFGSENAIYGSYELAANNLSGVSVAMPNNFWGDPSGPYNEAHNPGGKGDAISDGIDPSPWLPTDPTIQPPPIECCSSVAFLPGIEASRLYKQTLTGEDQLWEPTRNQDIEQLFMDPTGKSVDPGIYTKDIIQATNYIAHNIDIYKSFSTFMDGLVSSDAISAWQAFPYDWRLDYKDIVSKDISLGKNARYGMISQIEALAAKSKTGKVTLVAHSNGGLVAKELVQELERQGKAGLIDKVILAAVPQLGTPVDAAILLHGYGEEAGYGFIMDASTVRTFAENTPMAYNLLPSQKLFDSVTTPFVSFDLSIDNISNLRKVYGDSIKTSATLADFFLAQKDKRSKPARTDIAAPNVLNAKLLASSTLTHQNLDNYSFPSTIAVYQIAGWGIDTIKSMHYYKNSESMCLLSACTDKGFLDYAPLFTAAGDGTVVAESALGYATSTYYVDLGKYNSDMGANRDHSSILEAGVTQDFIHDILEGNKQLPSDISKSKPTASQDKLELGVHSPVTLDMYDADGRHTGPIPNKDPASDIELTEANIPNSYYTQFGEGHYAGVPAASVKTISIKGTGVGSFTLDISRVLNDVISTSTEFADIPVLPTTNASLSFATGTAANTPKLSVDIDGDGTIDFTATPGQDIDPIAYLTSMKSVIKTFKLNKIVETLLLQRVDRLITLIKTGKIKTVTKTISRFIRINSAIQKHRKITNADIQTIIAMLSAILDSLQ